MNTRNELNFAEIMQNLIKCAKEAGEIVLDIRKKKFHIQYKDGDKKNLLTEADLASQMYIVQKLQVIFPNAQIISEEMGFVDKKEKVDTFFVDPLDGTRQLANGLDLFSINIGLCVGGEAVVGVVHLPAVGRTYCAYQGGGAYLIQGNSTTKIFVSDVSELTSSTTFAHESHHYGKGVNMLKKLPVSKKSIDIASGYKICLVAEGKIDFFVNTSSRTKSWDICASQIILEEAGGVLVDFAGKRINHNPKLGVLKVEFIASNDKVLSDIQNFLE